MGRHRRPRPAFPYTPGKPAPTTNDEALSYVGDQGRAQGAARFSRLEGAVYDNGVVYFTLHPGRRRRRDRPRARSPTATATASARSGRYHTRSETLQLVYQSPARDVLDFPDNVTTSRRGTLVLCEDNTNDNYCAA